MFGKLLKNDSFDGILHCSFVNISMHLLCELNVYKHIIIIQGDLNHQEHFANQQDLTLRQLLNITC